MFVLRRLTQCVVIVIPDLRPRRGDRAQLIRIGVGIRRRIRMVIVHRQDIARRVVGIGQDGVVVVRDGNELVRIVICIPKAAPAHPVRDLC